jgi:hypothetical protein
MTKIFGNGIFKEYSQDLCLHQTIRVKDIGEILKLPQELSNNLIVVRQSRKLNDDEEINNSDEIYLFFAAMGG